MGLTPDLVTGVWVGAEDRSVRFSALSLGMGTNTALPIFAYYTKFVNADDSLDVSQGDFEVPETILKSPIDCVFGVKNNQTENITDDSWEEEQQDEW